MAKEPYQIITINGLKTVLYPTKGFPAIKANLYFQAGSSYETGPQWGAFHLIEHLVFEQTQAFDTWMDAELFKEEHGIRSNAFTGIDLVGFWAYGPSASLNPLLTFISQVAFNSLLPEQGIAKQLSIISQEYKGKWDNPRARFGRAISQQLYGLNHLYIRDGMGQPEFISKLSHSHLNKLYREYFRNENALLTLTGDFDPNQAKNLIQDLFTKNGGKSFDFPEMPIRAGERTLLHTEDVQQEKISICWPAPGFKQMDFHQRMSLRIGSYILGGSARSLLNQRLREELHLVYGTGFARSSHPFAGNFECWTTAAPENRDLSINEAKKVIYQFLQKPIDKEHFLRSKKYLMLGTNLAFDSIHSVSDSITSDMSLDGVIRLPTDITKEIQSITEAEVRENLAKYLTPENEFVAIMTKQS